MAKIMIVDDDVEATSLLDSFLSLDGYETKVVNDSTAVVKMAGTFVPDIFLLDLMMPVLDGFKLCRMLRETPKFFRTPVIILTALNDEDSKAVAFGAGADDYITKPYRPDDLRMMIQNFVKRSG